MLTPAPTRWFRALCDVLQTICCFGSPFCPPPYTQHHYWGTYVTLPNVGDAAHGIDCWESRGGVGQQGQVIYAHARQDGLGGCINIYGQGNTGALYVECPPESECTGPLC